MQNEDQQKKNPAIAVIGGVACVSDDMLTWRPATPAELNQQPNIESNDAGVKLEESFVEVVSVANVKSEESPLTVVTRTAAEGGDAMEDPTPQAPVEKKYTTVVQHRPIFFEIDPKKWKPNDITLDIPNQTTAETNELMRDMPAIDYQASKEGRELLRALKDANFTTPYKDWMTGITRRGDSQWVQHVPSEVGNLFASLPKFHVGEGKKLSGEASAMRMRSALGMGTLFKVPMWHTGIWLTFKAPTEHALLELNRRLTEEKVRLGRQTHGLAFSNNSSFFIGHLVDFAIAHIQQSNLIETEKSWHEIISALDIPALLWGLAYVIWPQGFQYARHKLDPITGTTSREEALLKLGSLQFQDMSSLSPWQIKHMAKQTGKVHNLDSLRRYKEEFLRGQTRRITINEACSIDLAVPTIAQYIESGNAWVNDIVAMVDRAFSLPAGDKLRHDYILEHGRATNARQFAHWVSAIHINGDVVDDVEDIAGNLDILSGTDENVDLFFDEVRKYQMDSSVSVIAVPTSDLNTPSTKMEQFPNLLELDVASTFFILLYQKVQNLTNRL